MTFDEFKKDLLLFIENATVNLGRTKTKTRDAFFVTVKDKFDAFEACQDIEESVEETPEKPDGSMSDRLVCLKPNDRRKALDVGKGVHAMTASESMRADEQLNRSPYTGKNANKGKKDE